MLSKSSICIKICDTVRMMTTLFADTPNNNKKTAKLIKQVSKNHLSYLMMPLF